MESYRYPTHSDGCGNVMPGPEVTQVTWDEGCESSHLYGFPLCLSTVTPGDGTIPLPDTLCNQSGRCQYDDRAYPDFRPYSAYPNDNPPLLDFYLHPLSGFIHPSALDYTDYTGEGFQTSYRPCNDQCSQLRPAVTSTTSANFDKSYFQKLTIDDSRRLNPSPGHLGEHPYLQQRDCNSMMLCNSDSQILYVNNPDTGELKSYQVLSRPEKQLHRVAPKPETTENIGRFPDGSEPPPALRCYLPPASMPHITIHDIDKADRALYALNGDVVFPPESNMEGASNLNLPGSGLDSKLKRPCNCSKTHCLKLYCDCFANGDFCSNCNCYNCYNNIFHDLERCKAIKSYLEKNPEAFQPKIGMLKTGDVKPRHTKGCNCKRSGCLKNYCECYEAKIMCSPMCRCLGCKNYEESPDRKYLRDKQQYAYTESILQTCASIEVVRAACTCLLARAEVAERQRYSVTFAEQMIIEEFGKCLEQMLQKS